MFYSENYVITKAMTSDMHTDAKLINWDPKARYMLPRCEYA